MSQGRGAGPACLCKDLSLSWLAKQEGSPSGVSSPLNSQGWACWPWSPLCSCYTRWLPVGGGRGPLSLSSLAFQGQNMSLSVLEGMGFRVGQALGER